MIAHYADQLSAEPGAREIDVLSIDADTTTIRFDVVTVGRPFVDKTRNGYSSVGRLSVRSIEEGRGSTARSGIWFLP
jgi:hypothetical protein